MKRLPFLISATVILIAGTIYATGNEPQIIDLSALQTKDPNSFAKALMAEANQLHQEKEMLVNLLRSRETAPGIQRFAAQMLGDLRAEEGTSALLAHLTDFPEGLVSWKYPKPVCDYVCAISLVNIGEVAVPHIIDLLGATTMEKKDVPVIAAVLQQISGRDAIRQKIQQAIDKKGHLAFVGRLPDVLDALDQSGLKSP